MKRHGAVFVIFLIVCWLVYAGIAQFDVEVKMKGYVRAIHIRSTNAAIDLGNTLQDAKDLVLGYGSHLEADDKTKLSGLETKVTTAKNALDDVILYIETNWPAIGEE